MIIEKRIEELGFVLPKAPEKGGVYSPCRQFGENFAYVSGCGPTINGSAIKGKIGYDIDFEQGCNAARNCVLNVLSVIKAEIGDLDKISKFVKALVFVSSDNNFFLQPEVANAASQMIADIFGNEVGLPARSAIGVNVLPQNISVEIEMLIELKK